MNNITVDGKTKVCKYCNRTLPADVIHFHRKKGGKYGLNAKCKECKGGSFGIYAINTVLEAKEGYKYCGKCKKELPLDSNHFYKHKRNKNGWGSWCKVCWGGSYGVHQINKTFRAKKGHKYCAVCEKELPYEKFSKMNENRDGYNSSCRECESIRNRKYQLRPEVKEKRAKYQKKWRKRYYATPAGKAMNAKHLNLRRSRKENTIYNYSDGTWQETLEFFNHKCAYCGQSNKPLTQEHIIPLSKGGYYTKQNIIPACHFCNTSKKDRNLLDWYPTKEYFSERRLNKINRWAGIDNKSNTQQLSIL